jgi:hypothetical protein
MLRAAFLLMKRPIQPTTCLKRALHDIGPIQFLDPSFTIPELNPFRLNSISKLQYGVEYLSLVDSKPSFPATGFVFGREFRLLINLCCRADEYGSEKELNRGPLKPWVNVLFVFNSLSPWTYLSGNARARLGCHHEGSLQVQMHSMAGMDTYPAPRGSHFNELNILGLDFFRVHGLKIAFIGKYADSFEISPSD